MYPLWGRPNLHDWTFWRTALKDTFCTDKDRELKLRLGSWTTIPPQWEYFAIQDSDTFQLMQKDHSTWYEHKRLGRSKITYCYSNESIQTSTPPSHLLFPVTVRYLHKSLIMDHPSSVYLKYIDTNRKPYNISWLHIDQFQKGSSYRLSEAIKLGKAIAVNDGSYLETLGRGTASWMITTLDRTSFVTAGALSPGDKQIQSPY